MAQIDFAIAFVVVFTMISYSVFIVSGTITKDFNYFNLKEIEKSHDSLSRQLFDTMDSKSLISNFKEVQISFEEIGGYNHTENLKISIKPLVEKIHVYNQTMDEIASVNSTEGNYTNVSFNMDFSTNQIIYVSVFYSGSNTDEIIFNNNVTQDNVTANIISEKDVPVLSQNRCDYLRSLGYDAARNSFGFTHRFRIDNHCVYGEVPPIAANIIVKSVPLFVERIDESIYPEQVILKVW
ncbi:MAG: hypothetical protein ABIE55_02140 [Candidatus Aenigmatarchaeota archaeon]